MCAGGADAHAAQTLHSVGGRERFCATSVRGGAHCCCCCYCNVPGHELVFHGGDQPWKEAHISTFRVMSHETGIWLHTAWNGRSEANGLGCVRVCHYLLPIGISQTELCLILSIQFANPDWQQKRSSSAPVPEPRTQPHLVLKCACCILCGMCRWMRSSKTAFRRW